jgi:hypothetical protein
VLLKNYFISGKRGKKMYVYNPTGRKTDNERLVDLERTVKRLEEKITKTSEKTPVFSCTKTFSGSITAAAGSYCQTDLDTDEDVCDIISAHGYCRMGAISIPISYVINPGGTYHACLFRVVKDGKGGIELFSTCPVIRDGSDDYSYCVTVEYTKVDPVPGFQGT